MTMHKEQGNLRIQGHLKIFDPQSNEVFVNKRNAIHYENYSKVIDPNNSNLSNLDPARNFMEVRHILGTYYSDILVSCLLDFGEPQGQAAFDNATNSDGQFVFDEIGLKAYSPDGPGMGDLLTHVIFHPVQKSLNRMIQIDYTVRIQSLANGI